MKKFIHSIILCLFLVFGLTAKSQNLGIDTSLGPVFNFYPDTINLNDSFTHTIIVKNKSAVSLTGTIYLVAAVDTSGFFINSIDTVGTVSVTNFGLNDTVGITYTENYTFLNGYKIGGNIVVVWPIADFGSTADTLFKNIFINYPLSIVNAIESKLPLFYPNPSKDYLFFNLNHQESVIKRVRIVDVNGRLIYSEKYHSKIDVSHLSKGIYFLKLETKDEEELHYKFIKE